MTTVEGRSLRLSATAELQHEVEQFLYDEADLLDGLKFDEWFSLMAEDIHYWMPVRANRLAREQSKETSGPGESAYFDETHEFLAQRIQRLHTGMAWAEDPPSRTRHLVCNVRVYETANANEFDVESSFYIWRTRLEREVDMFVGKRMDVLRRADGPYGFQIAKRTIILDMSTVLAKNLSTFF